MKAVIYTQFGAMPEVQEVPDPTPTDDGVVIQVEATGLCRSDAHAWLGHDPTIALPHVPGHEFVGRITSLGPNVTSFQIGDRVTVPFVCACGKCHECRTGHGNVCKHQTQPGFTHWGSFAELVAVHNADYNLIRVPEDMDSGAAALLGCRYATAYRGIAHRARLNAGETLLVVGCGGVGLSAIQIGAALGARVIGVDINDNALKRAVTYGATAAINSYEKDTSQILQLIDDVAPGGVHVSLEALGREPTLELSILALSPGGRQVQVGLFTKPPIVSMPTVIAQELSLLGSHGMPAADYPELLKLVEDGGLKPQELIVRHITLDEAPHALHELATGDRSAGVTIIDVTAD